MPTPARFIRGSFSSLDSRTPSWINPAALLIAPQIDSPLPFCYLGFIRDTSDSCPGLTGGAAKIGRR